MSAEPPVYCPSMCGKRRCHRPPGHPGPHTDAPGPLPLAAQIRNARVAAGLSMGGLERALGIVGAGAVSRYESGDRTPSVDALRRIAAVTGVTFSVGLEEES